VAAGWAGGEPVSADAAAFAKAEAAARDDATDGSDADEGEEEMEGYEIEIPEGYTGGDVRGQNPSYTPSPALPCSFLHCFGPRLSSNLLPTPLSNPVAAFIHLP
jgi:hypothetical protein